MSGAGSQREPSSAPSSSEGATPATSSTRSRTFLGSLAAGLRTIEETLLGGGVLLIAVLTIANVIGRTFGSSIAAAEELSQFAIIFVTFVGVGYATSRARQIRMTALYDSLPEKLRKPLAIFIAASTSLLLFALTWLAIDYTLHTVRALAGVSPVLQLPVWVVYLSVPLGLGLGGVQYMLAVARNIASPGTWLSFEHDDSYDEETIPGA